MAVAQLTPIIEDSVVRGNADLIAVAVTKVTQNDWIEFDFPVGFFSFTNKTGVTEGATYAAGAVNEAFSDSDTSLTFDGATVAQWPATGTPFYIKISNEILLVTGYTSTVATVVRGRFGTTPASAADGDTFEVLNSIILPSAVVGKVQGIVQPLYDKIRS